jgi:aspartyl-tRNA(Asn)/glutamyl-tRNA(Gln) amidotransferase subunit B
MDPKLLEKYEPVIGLEVHAQMLTESKAFCGCSTEFSALPNHNTCPICLGHPGTLPALNENLVRFIVRMGLATNCQIRPRSIFARKNYFYPDLPKGYQVSQYETPICHDGWVDVELKVNSLTQDAPAWSDKRIGITRIHMEEDAGKSIHDFGAETMVDLNRAGVPLIEIVSEPDMRSSDEAYAYLTTIKSIVTYLGICDGNMEEGSLRCDANVSVRLRGAEKFGQKTEVKNMNSFRNVQRAIEAEIERQIGLIKNGEPVIHQTMLFDANKGVTRAMRTKEEAHDYRYFPEPDLLPVAIDDSYTTAIRAQIPELQRARRDRLVTQYALPKYDADVLTAERPVADFFEQAVANLSVNTGDSVKAVSNYMMGDVMRIMSEKKRSIDELGLKPKYLAELIDLVAEETISNKIAKDIFPELLESSESPRSIIEKRGLMQVSDEGALRQAIKDVVAKNPNQLEQYKSGKTALFGYFVGQTMKATGGKANPQLLNALVKQELENA